MENASQTRGTSHGPVSVRPLEHSNSGKKSFDSILATELIFSIRFGNRINLPLYTDIQIVS